jgi:hypothetical protein
MGARILSAIGILRPRSIAARSRPAQNDTWRSTQQSAARCHSEREAQTGSSASTGFALAGVLERRVEGPAVPALGILSKGSLFEVALAEC